MSKQQTVHQAKIERFMKLAGQEVPESPVIPDVETRRLRARLILEEALETIEALGFQPFRGSDWINIDKIDLVATNYFDIVEVADGCADLSVVTIGTLSAFGIRDYPILDLVDEANLRKFGPGGYRDEGGKWIKPPDFVGPNSAIMVELDIQGWKGTPDDNEF